MNLTQNNSPHRVLLVDDEEIVLVALRETLSRAGYQVSAFADPLQALEAVKQTPYAVVISDYQMPKMTGLQFLVQVKQLQPDTTRILITAVFSLDTVVEAINKGEIYRFIVKPWLREELLTTVKNAVQRYELICKNTLLQATTMAMNEQLTMLNKNLENQVTREAQQKEELARLNAALQENLKQSISLCLRTMETFYPTLGSQARRVNAICTAMAEVAQFKNEERQILEVSSWLYDIGLVGVSRHLIRKWQNTPESLTEVERAILEQHPILGQELAGFVQQLKDVGSVIRAHHEHFDGSGYPDHLSEENIPWLARLLGVAVAFAESNLSYQFTLDAIKMASGTVYDPDAVRVLLRALPTVVVPRKEREVSLTDLRPGMVLARGIYNNNGMLLIPEGQQLSEPFIDKLENHHRLTPITQTLLVFC